MHCRTQRQVAGVILLILLSLCWTLFLQAQDEPIPFDTTVVEIIERIPAPQTQQPHLINNCGYEPNIRQSSWLLVPDESGEPVLCYADTGEIRELPITANWIAYESGDYRQPSLSPDGEWLVLTAYGDEQYDYYAVSVRTDDVLPLGSIPYNPFLSTYPPNPTTWLSSTHGAIVHLTNSDSVWDTLYGFDLSVPNSMTEVMSGYPHAIDEPPARIESLYSGRWLSSMAGTSMGNMPCEFAIYDAEGLRIYPIEYDCQVEAGSPDPNIVCGVTRSDGESIVVLRVTDFDAGQSELVLLPVTIPEAEPTVLYRGEIDYMLENADGTTLSVLGTDGRIPYAIYQRCFVDLRQFAGSDLLIATRQGAHVIPAEEIPDNFSDFSVGILATSPDKSQVLLTNGAIYDVVEARLVANITGGALINNTTVTWHQDGRLVFTEDYSPTTDEQITIRLRE